MPFPALGMHTLSHVRFTPVIAWTETPIDLPGSLQYGVNSPTNAQAMIRDAARYMPIFHRTEAIKSIYAMKTVLVDNDRDDGRPILFEFDKRSKNVVSILGGKIDNIYDVFLALDELVVG